MPRVSSDKIITHRIELGIPERQKLDELIEITKENTRIDGVTATLQAAGSALAGGGLIWAAAAFAAYFAPGLLKEAYNKTKDVADRVIAPIVDPIVDELKKEYFDAIYEAGRKATEAGVRVDRFCSPGINFDAQQCTIAQNDFDAAKEEQRQAIENARNAPKNAKSEFQRLLEIAFPGIKI